MTSRRRRDVRAILADPDLRRKLMVPTVQATQAREGIETTTEQAERAYYVVTEGERTAFFDLARFARTRSGDDARAAMFEQALAEALEDIRFDVARRDFAAIESSPLAYRRVGLVAHVFRDAPAFDPAWGTAAQGLATAADERFVRHWWELPGDRIGEGRDWVPFAKGGEFSRFYADVYLAVQWTDESIAVMKRTGRVQNVSSYFQSGLTWPLRTQRGFSMRVMPRGCIFGHKGPALIPTSEDDRGFMLGVANSMAAEYLLRGLMSFGSWEVGVVKRLPVPRPTASQHEAIGELADALNRAKAAWDEGNEVSTRFKRPWLLRDELVDPALPLAARLDRLAEHEAEEQARIQALYADLDDEVFRLYGFSPETRAAIEETLGARPPEVLWPRMEGKTAEQKRMEHVYRLLSHLVRAVVNADQDGIVPFLATAGEASLVERVHDELALAFPRLNVGQVEVEIANELKKAVGGYRRVSGIAEWLENIFFDYHCSLYKNRPILWHVASTQGRGASAFGVIVHYHRFDADRMAKLRARYVRDALDTFRREAALAEQAGRPDERQEWQAKAEELADLDQRLQWVQEGQHEGPEGGDRDFRILTPWKPEHARPSGWDPDIDDGVKVNIAPLQKAAVLRRVKVV